MSLQNLSEIFKSTLIENNETYSLKLVTTWLNDNNINFIYSSSPVDTVGLYEHGVGIDIGPYMLSIQTHPSITGPSFAETLKSNNMLSDQRHKTPEDLFNYILSLKEMVKIQQEQEKH